MPLRVDAIVVLGCKILPSGRPSVAAACRASAGAEAFLSGMAPRMVVSGGRRWGTLVEARVLAGAIVRAGVPREAVVEELLSLSTHENALFTALLLRRLGARRAAIVTCAWHLPRALHHFRAAGVEATPLPSGARSQSGLLRLRRRAHELVSGWLDASAMQQAAVLRDSAAAVWPSGGGGLA